MKYTDEELASLKNIFLKSQFSAFNLFFEIAKNNKLKEENKQLDDLSSFRALFFADILLGYSSELFDFFKLKKDTILMSRFKTTSTQRKKIEQVRNSIFHITNLKIESKRFKEFREYCNDPKLFEDLKIIGDYIFSLYQSRSSKVSEKFKEHWNMITPFDLTKDILVFKSRNLGL